MICTIIGLSLIYALLLKYLKKMSCPMFLVFKFQGNISVLSLLDFSSAFDTIDNSILVHRLHTDFGFTDSVLQ